jgi:transcriptional regulator with XRE-family HTH domain
MRNYGVVNIRPTCRSYLRIAEKAKHLRELGMSDRVIARRLGVSDKTVARAARFPNPPTASELE